MRPTASRSAFLRFSPGGSWLHLRDARAKLVSLGFLATAIMVSAPRGLIPSMATLGAGLLISHVPIGRFVREGRGTMVLIAIIIVASIATSTSVQTGAVEGSLYAARLLLLLVLAQLYVGTTSMQETRVGVLRLFRPLPATFVWRVATLLSLSVGFVSLPLDAAEEVRRGALVRGLSPRAHPIRYLKLLGFLVTIRSLRSAESRSQALELRSPPVATRPNPHPVDPQSLLLVGVSCMASGVALVL